MEQMLRFATDEPETGPLLACALLHYQFEAIHPFEDGNGRLGRLLVPLHLLAVGAIDRPVVYVSSFLERVRDEYIRRLRRVSTHGEWTEWLVFFLRAIEASCKDAGIRVRSVASLRNRYRAAASTASKSKLPLLAVDVALDAVYVTAPEMAQALGGVDYKSARGAIDTLCRIGALEEMPRAHPQRWVARALLEVAYRD
jgi:Fic family protein